MLPLGRRERTPREPEMLLLRAFDEVTLASRDWRGGKRSGGTRGGGSEGGMGESRSMVLQQWRRQTSARSRKKRRLPDSISLCSPGLFSPPASLKTRRLEAARSLDATGARRKKKYSEAGTARAGGGGPLKILAPLVLFAAAVSMLLSRPDILAPVPGRLWPFQTSLSGPSQPRLPPLHLERRKKESEGSTHLG